MRIRPARRRCRNLIVLGIRFESEVLAIRVSGAELLFAMMRDRTNVTPLRDRSAQRLTEIIRKILHGWSFKKTAPLKSQSPRHRF